MSDEFDNSFVPSDDILKSVGLTAKKTDAGWYNVIKTNQAKTVEMRAQNAVAAWTLTRRGHKREVIAAECEVDVRTIDNWIVQGQALLRTLGAPDATERTLAATGLGSQATLKMVDAATKVDATNAEKLERLERAAVASYIKSRFTTEDKKELSDDQVANIVNDLPAQAVANVGSDQITAKDMADAIPNIAESHAIVVKKRSSQQSKPQDQTLEAHFKAALESVKAQQKAEPDQPYEMTAADYKALFALMDHLEVPFIVPDHIVQSVSV
jgi:hypothetical protein